ncbi:uncharacterized protein LOC124197662 [Daphnia pulex]|uniref:uncharacterized protein LOC124197662 n=1 Tax=Daphnia pulex TaxID=6669 RepID=UPI001EDFB27D|nr:uncharacterized protein LOC124197662 [Daphnia pulex]
MVQICPLYYIMFNIQSKKKNIEKVSNSPRIRKSWNGTPYERQRLLVRKLRTKIDKLEDKLENIQYIVGSDLILLSKSDDHVKHCFEAIHKIFEEEENKSSEHHAKSSFLLDQILNFSVKKNRIRYGPWSIKYAIMLQGRTPTTYDFIRRHELLTMPSLPTLFSYKGRTKGKVGITNVNEERLKLLFNSLVEAHEKKISVEIDEMACRAMMMWIQSRQEFVGEVDFGEVDVDGIIEDAYNESEDDQVCEEIGKGIDVDGGKISEGAVCLQD